MSGLTICLWFDGRAEEAAAFYVETFRACGRTAARAGEGRASSGPVVAVPFTLDGQPMLALNGGPADGFTTAVSLVVACADQGEIDRFWDALSAGGAPGRCGWLTDRFGLSWQVVPAELGALMQDADPARRGRVMAAFMAMTKLDVDDLRRARDGG